MIIRRGALLAGATLYSRFFFFQACAEIFFGCNTIKRTSLALPLLRLLKALVDYCAYLRVSTDKQGITGLGMDAQREAVGRYVQNRGHIVAEFIEVESGKRHTNRPQLLAALAECRKRRAVLLIARLDRLARNVAFIANLMNSDVEFVAVDMPQANRLTIHILAAVAEHEREMISQRTKAALAAAKARGIKLGNPNYREALAKARAALSYRPPPPELLALMAEWRGQGDALRKIATRLNSLNIRTPQGFQWYAASVRTALLRESADERNDAIAHALHEDVALERNDGHTIAPKDAYALTSGLKGPKFPVIPSAMPSTAGREAIAEGAYMPTDLMQAQRMIDLFTSVGARRFAVTNIDINENKIWPLSYHRSIGKAFAYKDDAHFTARALQQAIPHMLELSDRRRRYNLPDGHTADAGENLIIRPIPEDIVFVQLDDLNAEQLDKVRPAAFLIHQTSPGNHQAWVAVSGVSEEPKEFIRRVRKAVGEFDKSASGSTRIAGSANWKIKYLPNPPMVSIVQGIPGRIMTPEDLQQLNLLAEPEPVRVPVAPPRVSRDCDGSHPWPRYDICLMRARKKKDGSPDRSHADISFAMIAITGGHSIEDTAAKLAEVSEKARDNVRKGDTGYPLVTSRNAADYVARNKGRSRA